MFLPLSTTVSCPDEGDAEVVSISFLRAKPQLDSVEIVTVVVSRIAAALLFFMDKIIIFVTSSQFSVYFSLIR